MFRLCLDYVSTMFDYDNDNDNDNENDNDNQRVTWTAFAILAMFIDKISSASITKSLIFP